MSYQRGQRRAKSRREEVKRTYACNKFTNNDNESIKKKFEDEKIEEREIKATSQNPIIHGMVEDIEEAQDGLEREDKLFVRNIMSSFLGLSVKIKKTQRIETFTKER